MVEIALQGDALGQQDTGHAADATRRVFGCPGAGFNRFPRFEHYKKTLLPRLLYPLNVRTSQKHLQADASYMYGLGFPSPSIRPFPLHL